MLGLTVAMTGVLKGKVKHDDGRLCEQRNAWICVCVLHSVSEVSMETDQVSVSVSHACRNIQMLHRCFQEDLCASLRRTRHLMQLQVSFLPGGSGVGQSSHTPRVPVLVSDLLLHLSVCEGLQQGAPLVCVTCVADGNLYCREWVLTEGVGPLVPAELTANAVGDSGDELSTQTELRAKLQCKRLRRVLSL